MKLLLGFLFCLSLNVSSSQNANRYFESIRNNEAALTAFFTQMPKGGDLHHHFSGSVYAEPMLKRVIEEDYYLDTETMAVSKERPPSGKWEQFSALKSRGELERYKQMIMQKWSVKDYNGVDYPSDKLFFESFNKFGQAADDFEYGLVEIKNRAIRENVSYIETQLSSIRCNINITSFNNLNERFRQLSINKNEQAVRMALDTFSAYLLSQGAVACAKGFNTNLIEKLHTTLGIDDGHFTMRYQNYVLRFMDPVQLFKILLIAFISADNSPLVVGVNIVAPEDGETSLKDYWLHMVMYKYLHEHYPAVKYSMHAGELTLGMVQPENLSWHINTAVHIAKANRIGHGVDIAYEDNSYALLKYMARNKIAIEINLVSNEFILKVKEDRHPISLYKKFGVPITISTDDAGVLRTNMTEQYVKLAKRYRHFSYADIKQIVYNSILYSFIEDGELKKRLSKDLDSRFKVFESKLPVN
jgi:hypothetical protein